MPGYYDTLPFNPFIHGTSSQTLSLMRNTDYQLMPVLAMLQNFKVAPMVGELTQGGFDALGEGSNNDTMIGAASFGRMQHDHYNLDRIVGGYTRYPNPMNLNTCKENFENTLKCGPKAAFANLNLLMIYLVRLRQLGVKIPDIVSLDEVNALKERLDATVQFYYFLLCVQKYIFIDAAEIERFKQENNLNGSLALGDYILHFFSFEHLLEKLIDSPLNIEEIYNDPSPENINKLINLIKISSGNQGNIKRYPDREENFIAKRDYQFFTAHKPDLVCKKYYTDLGGHLFNNLSGYSFAHYLEKYYEAHCNAQEKATENFAIFPNFEKFHTEVVSYIDALKDRVQLCKKLIEAEDDQFVLYHEEDELIANPFPVVFVTETKSLDSFRDEYRSRAPLKLGTDIVLVATDTQENQARLRDYLQKNNVGPVEVLLFDDLHTLRSNPMNSEFDAFANDDLIKAFELAKQQDCADEFSKLYRALSELNEKRYRFKVTNPEVHEKLDNLFAHLQQNILTPDKSRIDFKGMHEALLHNKQQNDKLYATHRGILGVLDTVLTILASLVIFYPITYLVQKNMNSMHTFFATDTEKKLDNALLLAEEMTNEMAIAVL